VSGAVASCAAALVLLLDASGSIPDDAWGLQVEGHRAALAAPEVVRLVERGGPVAVAAFGFAAGVWELAPWSVLRSGADARAFGDALAAGARDRASRFLAATATGTAIRTATEAHERAPCEADERITDLVSDGTANAGRDTARARDDAAEAGIRVNALAVRTEAGADDPAAWLRETAMTPGGFVLEADGWDRFAEALRRKLARELAAR
jgi:Protein of unknown function (DUF1194)